MRIVTFNVNGLRARAESVRELWDSLAPDIYCLQETKCSAAQVPPALGQLPGTLQHFNAGPAAYSGTAIIARRSAVGEDARLEVPPFDAEGRSVALHWGDRTLVTLYMPNGGKDYPAKLAFYDALIAWVAEQLSGGRKLWLAGDMNIAHTDMDIHPRDLPRADIGVRPEERAKMDELLDLGLRDEFREAYPTDGERFTWWPYWRQMREKNRGWRIDYHLVSPNFGEVTSVVTHMPKTGSDHAPILAEVTLA